MIRCLLFIYAPCKSNLNFAGEMADKIKKSSSILFSNNTSFKKRDGVYVRNFTNNVIKDIKFILLGERLLMVVILTENGAVKETIIK